MNVDRIFMRLNDAKTRMAGQANWVEDAERALASMDEPRTIGYAESLVANAITHAAMEGYRAIVELARALEIAEEAPLDDTL